MLPSPSSLHAASMATPVPRAPPPSPLLLLPPTLILPLRLPLRRLRLAAAATATAAAAAVAPDDISQLNHRLRALVRRRDANSTLSASSAVDPAQAEAYLHMIREQQRLGLRQLRRDGADGEGESEGDDGEEGSRRKGVAAGSSLGHRVDPRELEPGEYVVHKKVGVGKFVCISGEDGVDYVFIQYADAMAKLAVDHAARMLYRYNLPHEKKRPRNLSKLNDPSTWEKRRLKGKLAVQKMVVNLMELYLQRMRQRRPPYPKPVAMDQFAAEFPYEPTLDQNQAFIDVEKDLTERETPMDRLICGDVGFGKTEVAIRAIFIVVSAGYQAMVLAPTIILAKQHYDVMSDRFSNYPDIKVAIFSGAQSKEEKDELITKIKNGDLQIIVGTHALLTERMAYNNLSLLVVDEEQKFGVQQKEKIASYKASIDVLTLSATPIPRTLYLALTGFRDASLMSTPPPERVAVKTYVSSFSRERALSAIKFELKRGGQVFYVVPRIKAIDGVLQFLKDSLPDVPMAVAHGKKVSKSLQLTMEKFACGEVKILVCTHIIESGIDIPNANTMIVQYAELFGLAQLYQLRGRVGRSGREGFTYLFYTDKSLLSRIAMDRLGAIEEHSDLGQGFHVAEKDMGIRGFGSLFGEQQSGDVANVGIDLFFDMLFDSLSKVDQFCLIPVPYKDVQLDINISPHLSSEYISYLENPVELLNEAAKAAEKDIWTLMQFTEDLRRQYGKEPRDMELLLKKLYVRRMAADLGISRIYPSGKMIIMKTSMNKKAFRLMTEAMASETHRNSLSFNGKEIKSRLRRPRTELTACPLRRATFLAALTQPCPKPPYPPPSRSSESVLHSNGEPLLLACHLLLSLALLAASLSHLLLAAVSHLSPTHTHHLRLLRHPLLRLLPILLALPFAFLPVSPTSRLLPLLLLPPLLLPLPLPFLSSSHLQLLQPLLLSLGLLLLARAAGLLTAAFPASDLQQHALSVAALLLVVAASASLASAMFPPRTAQHFLAETALACAGAVGGLWALQSGLSLYVDSCVPAGCHRLMDAAAAPATRCDVEEARLRAVAVMDLALSVHCVIVAGVAAGVYLWVARWCGVDGRGGGAGVGIGRRHNGVGGSYDALPMVASAGAIAEMEHLPLKGVVGKSVAQE